LEASTINIHADLIGKCRNDDRTAQFEIYKLYSKAMYNTALRITGGELEAEDALQESFVSAFKNIHNYRSEASFGSWLKRIVINKSLNLVQKTKKDLMMVEDLKEDMEVVEWSDESEPEYSVEKIKQVMNELPSGFRTVLTLYLFEGYDHKEIAEILGITESTSKSQYKRAKDKLKQLLKEKINYG
jgi:RNA polymerase sigma-70 factor (ECF subfamily)